MRLRSLATTALFTGIALLFSSVASAQWLTTYPTSDISFNNGKVGIGTSVPTQKLTVGGNAEIADVPAGGPELINNGVDWTGNGSIGNNWATWYWTGAGGSINFTTYVLSNSQYGFSGNYQRVEFTSVTGTTGGKLYQALTFQKDHLYRVSFKYRASYFLQVTLGDNEGGGYLNTNTGNAIAVTMITGPTIQNRSTLDFYAPGGGVTPTAGQWFEVDDVSVKDVTFGGDLYVHGNMTVGSVDTTGGLLTVRKDQAATTSGSVRNYTAGGIARLNAQSFTGSLSLEQIGTTGGGTGARYNDGGVVYGNGGGGVGVAAAAPAGVLRFYTGGDLATNERMRIDASGNVGVGFTSPGTRLDVLGTAAVYGGARRVMRAIDDTPMQAGVGAGIDFVGKYDTAGNYTQYANLKGVKVSGTSGDYTGKLVASVDNNSGSVIEIATIDNSGLTVAGNIVASGNITGAKVINAVYQDVAEWVPATTHMDPGTVVVLNRDHDNEVMPSMRAYDTAVAGVISANPGVVLGVASDSKAQVATTGRVKVHVDATKAPIAIGDLLVTGDKPGTAMKSQPIDLGGVAIHRPGTVIGKALQPLPAGEGEILVLLSLQ